MIRAAIAALLLTTSPAIASSESAEEQDAAAPLLSQPVLSISEGVAPSCTAEAIALARVPDRFLARGGLFDGPVTLACGGH